MKNKRDERMTSSEKKIKSKGPSMIPALSPNGLAGIVPGSGIKPKSFNGCLSIYQMISPIVCFCIKKKGFFHQRSVPQIPAGYQNRFSQEIGLTAQAVIFYSSRTTKLSKHIS